MGIFMKWDKSIVPVGKLPLRFLFVIGFAVGFLIVYWGKGTFLKNMGMLDEDTLYHMKYMAVDNKVLFWYVLCKRGKDFIALVLMATTYLGLLFCGVMIESYIEEGNQKVGAGCYGKSITDPCLGWDDTERLIYDIAEYE